MCIYSIFNTGPAKLPVFHADNAESLVWSTGLCHLIPYSLQVSSQRNSKYSVVSVYGTLGELPITIVSHE
jgi:hypothetical protein